MCSSRGYFEIFIVQSKPLAMYSALNPRDVFDVSLTEQGREGWMAGKRTKKRQYIFETTRETYSTGRKIIILCGWYTTKLISSSVNPVALCFAHTVRNYYNRDDFISFVRPIVKQEKESYLLQLVIAAQIIYQKFSEKKQNTILMNSDTYRGRRRNGFLQKNEKKQ